jgi:hypothetical protein
MRRFLCVPGLIINLYSILLGQSLMPALRCSSATILSLSREMEQSSWNEKDPRKKLSTTWIFKQKKTT